MRIEPFTDTGFFWLPEDEDGSHRVPGTLSVSETGRVTLETFGLFSSESQSLASDSEERLESKLTRIFGVTREHGAITIIDALQIHTGFRTVRNGGTFLSTRIIASHMLIDSPLVRQELILNRIVCEIEGLNEWLNISGISVDYNHDSRRATITVESPSPLKFQVNSEVDGEFGFGFEGPSLGPFVTETSVSQNTAVVLSTSNGWTIEDAIGWGVQMRNFLCLTTDEPVAITSLKGGLDGSQNPEASETDRVNIIFESADHCPYPAVVKPWAVALRRQDIGVLSNVLSNWFAACRRLSQPFGLFFGARYRENALPADIRFLKLVEAMETLDRATTGIKKTKLATRATRLLKPFAKLLGLDGDTSTFAEFVSATRNFYVHNNPPGKLTAQGSDLLQLSRLCEALLICHLTSIALGGDDEAIRVLEGSAAIRNRVQW